MFEDSFSYFFMASFGGYDIDIFKTTYLPDRPNMSRIGILFVFSFVFLNLLILINVVIAMMADTYGIMTSLRLGIYSHSVLRAAPAYAQEKHYGALALLPAPFALISFLTIPYYLCVSDKARLRKFTKRFNIGIYFFLCLIMSFFFIAFNMIMVPFAYLKTCFHKIRLAHQKFIPLTEPLIYILLGLLMGVVNTLPDFWEFLKCSWLMAKPKRVQETFVISRDVFDIFYKIVSDFEK